MAEARPREAAKPPATIASAILGHLTTIAKAAAISPAGGARSVSSRPPVGTVRLRDLFSIRFAINGATVTETTQDTARVTSITLVRICI